MCRTELVDVLCGVPLHAGCRAAVCGGDRGIVGDAHFESDVERNREPKCLSGPAVSHLDGKYRRSLTLAGENSNPFHPRKLQPRRNSPSKREFPPRSPFCSRPIGHALCCQIGTSATIASVRDLESLDAVGAEQSIVLA